MDRLIIIEAHWDDEARVWIATSPDVSGLVVEADTWATMIGEVRLVLPDLLDATGRGADRISLAFRAEERLDLAGA